MSKDAKEYYDDFSTGYEKERHHGYHAMIDELELEVLRPLAQDKEVLEVGCGTGLLMQGLKNHARSISGIDLSSGMLRHARERGHEVVQSNATRIPFKDESFDLVYSYKVLAHIPQIEQALAEMSRVLKPGGFLVAEFYNALSLRRLAKWVGGPGKISDQRTEADIFTRWDTPDQVLGYLPAELTFHAWQGVRVFTPTASVFDLPLMDKILPAAEKLVMTSPLSKFGGFLIAICRKG